MLDIKRATFILSALILISSAAFYFFRPTDMLAFLPALIGAILANLCSLRPAVKLSERRLLAAACLLFAGLLLMSVIFAAASRQFPAAMTLIVFAGAGAWLAFAAHRRSRHRRGRYFSYFVNE